MKKLEHYARNIFKELLHNNKRNTVLHTIDTLLFVKTHWHQILACSLETNIAKEIFKNTEIDNINHETLFVKVNTTQTRFILNIHQHNILNAIVSIQATHQKPYVHIKKIMFISY